MREALKLALEALENEKRPWEQPQRDQAITAIKAALAAPVQEPVAWREFDGEGGYTYFAYQDNETWRDEYIERNGEKYANWVGPLYTASSTSPAAPVQEPVYSIEKLDAAYELGFAEGRKTTPPAAPVQEPSRTQTRQIVDGLRHCLHRDSQHEFLKTWIRDWTVHKLITTATAQRPWVGLTDEDMTELDEDGVLFARYIEAKLKAKNHG